MVTGTDLSVCWKVRFVPPVVSGFGAMSARSVGAATSKATKQSVILGMSILHSTRKEQRKQRLETRLIDFPLQGDGDTAASGRPEAPARLSRRFPETGRRVGTGRGFQIKLQSPVTRGVEQLHRRRRQGPGTLQLVLARQASGKTKGEVELSPELVEEPHHLGRRPGVGPSGGRPAEPRAVAGRSQPEMRVAGRGRAGGSGHQ